MTPCPCCQPELLMCDPSPPDAATHPLNVLVTVQSCVLCPAQASVSTTSCMTSSPCATPTRTWTSTSTASSAAWFGSKPCSVSQSVSILILLGAELDHNLAQTTLRQLYHCYSLYVSFCFFLTYLTLNPIIYCKISNIWQASKAWSKIWWNAKMIAPPTGTTTCVLDGP